MADEKSIDQKKARKRSPAYPAINLETALARATELEVAEHDAPIYIDAVVGHWGYTPKSSSGWRILSALKQYGLIEDVEGSGKDRRVHLSKIALDIILDNRPDSVDRQKNIKIAALTPSIFKRLYDNGQHRLLTDANFSFHLTRKEDFNPKAVHDFIEVWKDTFIFANLGENDILSGVEEPQGEKDEFVSPPGREGKNGMIQPQGFQDYKLSLGGNKEIVLRAPLTMSSDDYEFMTQWLKRLNLVKPDSTEPPTNTNEEEQKQQ